MLVRLLAVSLLLVATGSCVGHPGAQGTPTSGAAAATPVTAARAILRATTLEFEFPALVPDSIGCGLYDTPPFPGVRRYYWLATAQFPGVRWPSNHFQQVGLSFYLPSDAQPTTARLDSAFGAQQLGVSEAAGEPPMQVRAVSPERAYARVETVTLNGATKWRVRLVVEGKAAVRAFLAAGADSVSLGWCQRNGFMNSVQVPLEVR